MIWFGRIISCDHCHKHFDKDSAELLGGVSNEDPERFLDYCTTCAKKLKIDVCHGSCLVWHKTSELDKDGLCPDCHKETRNGTAG